MMQKSAVQEIGLFPLPEQIDMAGPASQVRSHVDAMMDRSFELLQEGYLDAGEWFGKSAEAYVNAAADAWIAHDISENPDATFGPGDVEKRREVLTRLVTEHMLLWHLKRSLGV